MSGWLGSSSKSRATDLCVGVCFGVAVGAGFGVTLGNMALGIGLGVAAGALLGLRGSQGRTLIEDTTGDPVVTPKDR